MKSLNPPSERLAWSYFRLEVLGVITLELICDKFRVNILMKLVKYFGTNGGKLPDGFTPILDLSLFLGFYGEK